MVEIRKNRDFRRGMDPPYTPMVKNICHWNLVKIWPYDFFIFQNFKSDRIVPKIVAKNLRKSYWDRIVSIHDAHIAGLWKSCTYRWPLKVMHISLAFEIHAHIAGLWKSCTYRWPLNKGGPKKGKRGHQKAHIGTFSLCHIPPPRSNRRGDKKWKHCLHFFVMASLRPHLSKTTLFGLIHRIIAQLFSLERFSGRQFLAKLSEPQFLAGLILRNWQNYIGCVGNWQRYKILCIS